MVAGRQSPAIVVCVPEFPRELAGPAIFCHVRPILRV
jgi:hypothetical protein